MNLKSINRRAISFKIAILAIAVAFATMVGLGIFVSNQAKAVETDNASNGAITVTHNLAGEADQNLLQDTGWYPSSDIPVFADKEWSKNENIIEKYAEGKTINSITYRCGFESTSNLYVTFVAPDNYYRVLRFHVGDTNKYVWTLDGVEVPIAEQQMSDITSDHIFICENILKFNVGGTVVTDTADPQPIEGASVQYFDNNRSAIKGCSDTTDADGDFYIRNVPTSSLPGYLVISHPDYESEKTVFIRSVEDSEIDLGEITFSKEDDEVNYSIAGGEHHINFIVTMTATAEGKTETEVYTFDKLEGDDLALGTIYKAEENGHLTLLPPEDEEMEVDEIVMDVAPVAEDGYIVDKWSVNGSDLVVGETYTAIDDIEGLVTYKAQTTSAQTGDTMPFAAIALSVIALFAGAVLLRKSFK